MLLVDSPTSNERLYWLSRIILMFMLFTSKMQKKIEQLYNPLLLFIKKRINNKEDAEDITQEVFLKLSKSNNEAIDNMKSWVYTIAKNTITDYYRKHKIYTEDIEKRPVFEEENDDKVVEELSSCITSYVNALPEEYRAIMTLSELKNVPQKEIALQLDMNYVTVRSKIQRGRKKLKDQFSECCTIIQGRKGSILDYKPNEACESKSDCGSC